MTLSEKMRYDTKMWASCFRFQLISRQHSCPVNNPEPTNLCCPLEWSPHTYHRLLSLHLQQPCDLSAPLCHQVKGADRPLQAWGTVNDARRLGGWRQEPQTHSQGRELPLLLRTQKKHKNRRWGHPLCFDLHPAIPKVWSQNVLKRQMNLTVR